MRAIRDRLPKAQSFKDQFLEDIQTQEKNLILGPLGASPSATHVTGKTPPGGRKPRTMHEESQRMSNL